MRRIFKLLVVVLPLSLFSQYSDEELTALVNTSSEKQLILESSRMLDEGYYVHAEIVINKLLEINPESHNYNYRKGFVLSEGKGDFRIAQPYLEKAAGGSYVNYDVFSTEERGASIDALFYLARCYHKSGNFLKAEKTFKAFIDASPSRSTMTQQAELSLLQLKVAKKLVEYPKKNLHVVNLGPTINSSSPDYSPVVSFDGSALYFTSRRQWSEGQEADLVDPATDFYPEDIYVSYRNHDDTWTTPERLAFCKPDQNEASLSVSPDERRIYVYLDSEGNGDIFFSEFKTNRFRDVQSYRNKEINTQYWETHSFTTTDGKNVFFTSDRPGGFGGRDIYRVVKLPDGTWSHPFNLGPSINTPYDEESPFMAADNKTLYFASNGPKSMGGFDIMVALLDMEGQWSPSINLGYPMNSTSDDLFYTETLDGRRGYITSTRDDTNGEKDIYEIKNDYMNSNSGTFFKGNITTTDNHPIPEDITITMACSDCDKMGELTVYPRLRDGMFMIALEPCRNYQIIFRQKDGEKEFYREALFTDCEKVRDEIYREVLLNVDTAKVDSVNIVSITIPVDSAAIAAAELAADTEKVPGEPHTTVAAADLTTEVAEVTTKTVPVTETSKPATEKTVPTATTAAVPEKGKPAAEKTKPVKNPATTTTAAVPETKTVESSTITAASGTAKSSFKHIFSYNNAKISFTEGDMHTYITGIEKQLDAGKNVLIEVYSSASKVPTTTYKDNELLALARAYNMKKDLDAYFGQTAHKGTVSVMIAAAVVDGPEYKKDHKNLEKYIQYQYVELKTANR